MNLIKMSALAGVAVALAAAPSLAQGTDKVEKPITVLLGGFRSTNSGAETFTSLGARYDFFKTKSDQPIIVSAFVDYLPAKNGVSGLGGGAIARIPLVKMTTGMSGLPYGNFGLGALRFSGHGSNETKFQLKVGAGYELNSGALGEVNYVRIDDNGAFEFRVGFRF